MADVVIEVRTRTIGDFGPPGTKGYHPAELRPGEADLLIHRNRWGPTRTLAVAAQFHYARFIDVHDSPGHSSG